MLDVLIQARDQDLSLQSPTAEREDSAPPSEKWEKGQARLFAWNAQPLKYEGLSYTEIWISKAQGAHGLFRTADKMGLFPCSR